MAVPVCKTRTSLGVDGLASSVNLLLPDAFATGKLTAVPNVVVRELTTDKKTGLVKAASFLDRHSRREMSVKARVVVLAAGCLESTRLLLNSGLANSSGVLGHYLMDQVYGPGIVCSVPEARDGKATPGMVGGAHLFPAFATSTPRRRALSAAMESMCTAIHRPWTHGVSQLTGPTCKKNRQLCR